MQFPNPRRQEIRNEPGTSITQATNNKFKIIHFIPQSNIPKSAARKREAARAAHPPEVTDLDSISFGRLALEHVFREPL